MPSARSVGRMSPALVLFSIAVAAYLVGSIPFGLLLARYGRGVDVRRHGSGNIGATNVARTLGRGWGIACLLLDLLKGLLPTLLLPALVIPRSLPADWQTSAAVVCGIATICGHVFPVWLRFRGGKGVATGAGVAAVLCPPAMLAGAVAFGLVMLLNRIVALASMVAAVMYAVVALLWMGTPWQREHWPLTAFALLIPLLIIVRHLGNIRRILRGEEGAFAVDRMGTPPAETPEAP